MKKKINFTFKLVITTVILFAFIWYLVFSPMITFRSNEMLVKEAARDYYSYYTNELPTGERIKTLSLKKLYETSYLNTDIVIPHSTNLCSLDNSWVKVKRVNGDYKYYVYLECGLFKSNVDHEGPQIRLNGEDNVIYGIDEEYKELGVKSVIDNNDGKIDVKKVTISNNVDTSKIGEYEVNYSVSDSMNNKSVVTRTVSVVQKLSSTVKKALGDNKNYVGDPDDNYLRFSNMLFRIYGLDSNNNVVIVAAQDISNVNYSKLDKWLDYFYSTLNNNSKNMIVESKFCNMNVDINNIGSIRECNSYTNKLKVYIPSAVEVNNSYENAKNYMKPYTISWLANKASDREAFVTRYIFFGEDADKSYLKYDIDDSYGVRPMMVIDGEALIKSGDGSYEKPFTLGDTKKVTAGNDVNKTSAGEYIEIKGELYRVIESLSDGTVKVVSVSSLGNRNDRPDVYSDPSVATITYNPKDKTSVGYYINNSINQYLDTKFFVKHSIEVPIYKNKIIYGEESEVKKYNVMLSAPDMFEIFSAKQILQSDMSGSYWLKNTSLANDVGAAVMAIGVPVNRPFLRVDVFGIRVVAFIKKDAVISGGNGTYMSPYTIK